MNKSEAYGLISAIIAYAGIGYSEFGVFRVWMLIFGTMGMIAFWIHEIDDSNDGISTDGLVMVH